MSDNVENILENLARVHIDRGFESSEAVIEHMRKEGCGQMFDHKVVVMLFKAKFERVSIDRILEKQNKGKSEEFIAAASAIELVGHYEELLALREKIVSLLKTYKQFKE